jgi:hypothetical protein
MSKSFKDRINYYKHHEVPTSEHAMVKGKHTVAPEDVPQDVKDDPIYSSNAALRHGNNRQYERDRKTMRAKRDRLHRAEDAASEIADYDPTSSLR